MKIAKYNKENSQAKHKDKLNGIDVVEWSNSLNGIDYFANWDPVATTSTITLGRIPYTSSIFPIKYLISKCNQQKLVFMLARDITLCVLGSNYPIRWISISNS